MRGAYEQGDDDAERARAGQADLGHRGPAAGRVLTAPGPAGAVGGDVGADQAAGQAGQSGGAQGERRGVEEELRGHRAGGGHPFEQPGRQVRPGE